MSPSDAPAASARLPSLADPDRHLVGLTGLRGVAAAWVVAYHAGPAIESWLPEVTVLHPLTSMGYLGVDLFFALSGFVLCHRYLDTLGRDLAWPVVREFLLLRLARLYPVHLAVTALFGLYVWVLATTGAERQWDPLFGLGDLVQHVALVHAWLNQPLSWNVPSWSVSLEWLAYLCFPIVTLGVARIAAARRPVLWATLLAAIAYAPLAAQGSGVIHLPMQSFVANAGANGMLGVNMLRLVAGFVAGCAAFVMARAWQVRASAGGHPPAWVAGPVFVAAAGAIAYGGAHGYTEQRDTGWLIGPFLVSCMALVGLSAPWTRWLESATMVRAGLMSYSLYMTHWLTLSVLGLVPGVRIEAGVAHRAGVAAGGPALKSAFSAATLVACVAVGYLCWGLVEEPARKALRARLMGRSAAVPIEERARG